MKNDSITCLFKDTSVLLMLLLTFLLFGFNLFAIRQDWVFTTTYNDCPDVSIIESELIDRSKYSTTYRYVFENTSQENITFRVVGMYPYGNLTRHAMYSDHIYYIEADSVKEITVTFEGPFGRTDGFKHAPEIHIVEA